ncbi:hypothetical protein ILYODFUR_019841 [Ilyodon furcidens]|uniref:Uncharacterized protein n=1 Tax=Ilyodon furcidens TaxID=33524 RepID=A0ABV0SZL5_9TELE
MENQTDRMLIGGLGDALKSHWKVEEVKEKMEMTVGCWREDRQVSGGVKKRSRKAARGAVRRLQSKS